MTKRSLQAIILAAGKSSRFKTGKTKLLEKICGQEMILYPTRLLMSMDIPTTIVVGFDKEAVTKTVQLQLKNSTISFVTQEVQQGTGHAILCTKDYWSHDNILILNGDIPSSLMLLLLKNYMRNIAPPMRL